MTEKRYINDITDIYDTWFGHMGYEEPNEREIEEKDFLLIGVADSQVDAESICERLNEMQDELSKLSNFNLHMLLDKKNKEIEQLKQQVKDCLDSVPFWETALDDKKKLQKENEQLKQLLTEVEHELTSLTGLQAFDKCASQLGYVEVFDDDYWELDYSKMLKKIEKVLKGGDVE